MNERMIELAVNEYEDDETDLAVLRVDGGFINPELQALVEEAIKEYPDQTARMWLGGVAAIRVVEAWIIARAASERTNPQ